MSYIDTLPPLRLEESTEETALPLTLLVASADPDLRQIVARRFTEIGCSVHSAADGWEARELADSHPFDLVITDLSLPRMDGIELARELTTHHSHLPCLLLAERHQTEKVLEGYADNTLYNHFWKPLTDVDELTRMAGRAMEQRFLQRENSRLLTELRDTRTDLRALHSRLEALDKVAALGQMTASIAHDLDKPLQSLMAYAGYLNARLHRHNDEPLTAEQLECALQYLREMEQSSRRCHQAVAGILDYTRNHTESPGPIHPYEVLLESLTLLKYNLDSQGITLHLECEENLPPALANPRRLQQVFTNLLLNAQQAIGKSGGNIAISMAAQRDQDGKEIGVEIRIADTGPGIAPEHRGSLFEPFFTTRSRPENVGLGLPIARNIVREWQGELQIQSASNTGTVACVFLPLCIEMVVPAGNGLGNGKNGLSEAA